MASVAHVLGRQGAWAPKCLGIRVLGHLGAVVPKRLSTWSSRLSSGVCGPPAKLPLESVHDPLYRSTAVPVTSAGRRGGGGKARLRTALRRWAGGKRCPRTLGQGLLGAFFAIYDRRCPGP